jgi:hypothetical protein
MEMNTINKLLIFENTLPFADATVNYNGYHFHISCPVFQFWSEME